MGHVIGYYIHQDPSPQMMVQPTIDDAQSWSKEDLTPVLEETPVLRDRVPEAKAKDSKTTITKKHYPGGPLHIVGANSARGFRRISVKLGLMDEVDAYPLTAGNEGDQVELTVTRTDDYFDRKLGIGSTPTEEGLSRVSREMADASEGYYFVPCPHCGDEHIRLFREPDKKIRLRGVDVPVAYLKWPDDQTDKAAWHCPSCKEEIGHEHHADQLRRGYWRGEDWEYRDGEFSFLDMFNGRIGFNIWAAYGYSPNSTPAKMAAKFISFKDNQEKLKTFINTILGEEWREPGVRVDEDYLLERVEQYQADIPDGVLVLTAFADVQDDRIEAEVIGWDENEQSWSIDHQVFFGDPHLGQVWEDLKQFFKGRYSFADGRELSIVSMGVDSGHLPTKVYKFVKDFGYQHCYATKGSSSGESVPIIEDRKKRLLRLRNRKKGAYAPEIVGTHEAKTVVLNRLKIEKPGPAYCHFGAHCDLEYFKQLTAERLKTTYKNGAATRAYVKIRTRNEVLDLRVGNLVALRLANPNWDKWKEVAERGVTVKQPTAQKRKRRRMASKGIRR